MAQDRSSAERWLKKKQRQWAREDFFAKCKRAFKKPMQHKRIPVDDWDDRTKMLSSFRRAYADFFASPHYLENSDLQNHTTQLFWHRMYLQKHRMQKLGVTLDMESERVQRSDNPQDSLYVSDTFDGRYNVSNVNEAIYLRRSFMLNGQEIRTFYDHDSVSYVILSAEQLDGDHVACPNCGNSTSRSDLIDGCDYCGTKFTVEDLADRVSAFDVQVEVAKEGLSEVGRQANLSFVEEAGAMVRKYDPNFSIRNFRANVFNKVAAIHFADSYQQFSAFSTEDLSYLKDQYKNIAYIDFRAMYMWDNTRLNKTGFVKQNDFYVEDGVQHIRCCVQLGLFELIDGQIQLRMEAVDLELEKSADCMTQNICGPSVLKCKGCGVSLSLLDGKACPYCGRELDMMQHDWVITKYTSRPAEYGRSWREFD